MLQKTIGENAAALFSVCVCVACMEVLAGKGGTARSFRAVCAVAASVMALRAVLSLIQ